MLMNGIATLFSQVPAGPRESLQVLTFDTETSRSLRYGRQGVLDLDQLSAG